MLGEGRDHHYPPPNLTMTRPRTSTKMIEWKRLGREDILHQRTRIYTHSPSVTNSTFQQIDAPSDKTLKVSAALSETVTAPEKKGGMWDKLDLVIWVYQFPQLRSTATVRLVQTGNGHIHFVEWHALCSRREKEHRQRESLHLRCRTALILPSFLSNRPYATHPQPPLLALLPTR